MRPHVACCCGSAQCPVCVDPHECVIVLDGTSIASTYSLTEVCTQRLDCVPCTPSKQQQCVGHPHCPPTVPPNRNCPTAETSPWYIESAPMTGAPVWSVGAWAPGFPRPCLSPTPSPLDLHDHSGSGCQGGTIFTQAHGIAWPASGCDEPTPPYSPASCSAPYTHDVMMVGTIVFDVNPDPPAFVTAMTFTRTGGGPTNLGTRISLLQCVRDTSLECGASGPHGALGSVIQVWDDSGEVLQCEIIGRARADDFAAKIMETHAAGTLDGIDVWGSASHHHGDGLMNDGLDICGVCPCPYEWTVLVDTPTLLVWGARPRHVVVLSLSATVHNYTGHLYTYTGAGPYCGYVVCIGGSVQCECSTTWVGRKVVTCDEPAIGNWDTQTITGSTCGSASITAG